VVLVTLSAAWFRLQPDQPPAKVTWDDGAAATPVALTPLDGRRDPTIVRAQADSRVATISDPLDAPLRVEVAAADWCWVAADSDGERVLYRLVAPGEELVFEGRRVIALRLGNAGSVMVSINGGAHRSPGRAGEVVKMVVTPDNVEGLRDEALDTASGN
jgi:hypothetical protein